MQKPEPLCNDWDQVRSAILADQDKLLPSLILVAEECAQALRNNPPSPLTIEEQKVVDDELEDDPRLYDLLDRSDAITNAQHVLGWYEKGMAAVRSSQGQDEPDLQSLADVSIQCWDYIVLEYDYHQLAHMASLIAAQIVSSEPSFHSRTWLFRISAEERLELFLGLAQQLDVLPPPEVQRVADRISLSNF